MARANSGLLKPETVLEAARPPTSPLHSRFDWDDTEAAEKYRLWQARQLIRTCVEYIPGVAAPMEIFVSLSGDRYDGRGYRITTEVVRDEDLRAQMLEDALAELDVFRIKYRRLRELAAVFSAIRRVSGRS